jgi:hypothetical protein
MAAPPEAQAVCPLKKAPSRLSCRAGANQISPMRCGCCAISGAARSRGRPGSRASSRCGSSGSFVENLSIRSRACAPEYATTTLAILAGRTSSIQLPPRGVVAPSRSWHRSSYRRNGGERGLRVPEGFADNCYLVSNPPQPMLAAAGMLSRSDPPPSCSPRVCSKRITAPWRPSQRS